MHSTLAILLAVTASGQAPEAIPAPPGYQTQDSSNLYAQQRDGYAMTIGRPAQFAYPTGHIYPDVAPEGIYGPRCCNGWMYPNGMCGHRCVSEPHTWGNWWIPPGNMLPHYHYFSGEHGYRCFEPYNVTRVAMQQEFAKSYGGDPRHPYSNEVFTKVYEIYGKRHGTLNEEEVPPIPPADDESFNLDP